jgi:thiamine biosynthesis lipoprotein
MKRTRLMMGMPITVEVLDASVTESALEAVYSYFDYVDDTFSTYKEDSEISRINRKQLDLSRASEDMRLIFDLAEDTRQLTNGYFDIARNGQYDPSGIVKGWAIYNAAQILRQLGFQDFYVDAGGDIQTAGKNAQGQNWRVGIRNPFDIHQIIKVVSVADGGVATSGTSIRGQHIYDPKSSALLETSVVSLTVIGPNIFEADRFATAAFAMGEQGIAFIEALNGFEGYQIDKDGLATYTSGFERYTLR